MSSLVLSLEVNRTTTSKVLELAETVQHLHISSLRMILSSFSRMTPKPFPPFNKLLIATVTYLDKSSMLKSLNSFVPLTLVLTDNKP